MTTSLLVSLRNGDAMAGSLLDRLYREALVRFCWGYLGRSDEVEDAVQEICCKVLTAPSFPERFRPWIYRIARNHCLNLLRQHKRRKDLAPLPAESQIHEVLTGQLTRLVRTEQKSQLSDLVRRLPDAQREVLRLRYVEGLPRSDIAEVLSVPESLVKSRLFEGLRQLREQASLLEGS